MSFRIEILSGSTIGGWRDVDNRQSRVELAGELRSPFEGFGALWAEIHCAKDLPKGARFVGECIGLMSPAEDRAIGIVQNLSANRTQEALPHRPATPSGNYDEAGVPRMREVDDFACRVPGQRYTPNIHTLEFIGHEPSVEFGRSRFTPTRVQDMQERELGMKVACQSRGKDRSAPRGIGKVDGRNDSWQCQHCFTL
jgi:hypothetical protein